jgi:predicted phosphodiesterase
MRYAIISDIHSNLEALTTALAYIDTIDIDRIVCLGDIVGYGADPAACLDLVRSRTEYVVMGNHDFAAVHVDAAGEFNEYAASAVAWTARQLSPADTSYLRTLPYRFRSTTSCSCTPPPTIPSA